MLLTAALNPRPSLALRLLVWTTPSLPIGTWIAGMATGGAALSAIATGLALGGAAAEPLRRRVQRDIDPLRQDAEQASPAFSRWPGGQDGEEPSRRGRQQPSGWASAGPGREPGQPAPTVSVPFRVVRMPAERPEPPPAATAAARSSAAGQPEPVSAWEDDWGGDERETW